MTRREKLIFEKLNEHYEEAKTLGYEIFDTIGPYDIKYRVLKQNFKEELLSKEV